MTLNHKAFFSAALLVICLAAISLSARYPLTAEGKSPFVEVVRDIRESIVNIQAEADIETRVPEGGFPFDDDFFRFFFGPRPETRRSMSMGSGFIIDREGEEVYILTNNHVVDIGDNATITVTLADKAKYRAEVVGLDPHTDLAIIKINVPTSEEVVVSPLGDSDKVQIGEWAIAIGNPFGQLGLDRTVTVGVISAKGRASLDFGPRSPVYQDYIQTDAAINPGNSGGPLLNIEGKVIGVNTAITTTTGGNIGIGFAIPINMAKKVADDIMNKGRVVRAYLGILPQEITGDLQQSLGLEKIGGVLVASVEPDTPADRAGLKNGDVIIEFDNREVGNVPRFRIVVAESEIGSNVPIKIVRDNEELTLHAVLEEMPSDDEVETEPAVDDEPWLGLEVENLDQEFARRHQIEADHGVVITSIKRNSPAFRSDLRVGEVIKEINRRRINNKNDYQTAIAAAEQDFEEGDSSIILCYVLSRDGHYQYVTINLEE